MHLTDFYVRNLCGSALHQDAEATRPARFERRFFVYAEDDVEAVFLVRMGLRRLGAEERMVHCPDGEALITSLHDFAMQRHPPLFILLDLRLPRIDGFESLRRIRQTPETQNLPLVVFSLSPLDHEIRLATSLGATDFIVKPKTYGELLRTLEILLTRFGLLGIA